MPQSNLLEHFLHAQGTMCYMNEYLIAPWHHTCSIMVSVSSWMSTSSASRAVNSVSFVYIDRIVRSFVPLDLARFSFMFD